MVHIFRGEQISHEKLYDKLEQLEGILQQDLLLEPLDTDIVIHAVDKLVNEIDTKEIIDLLMSEGMTKEKAETFIQTILKGMTKDALSKKVLRELGEKPFEWKCIECGIYEKAQPFGVLMHIGAGNVVALSVISILEGMLASNINILKLPSYEGGISIKLLQQLIDIEPRLKPYIYVFDISSKDTQLLKKIGDLSDAIVVWGSDDAVMGIRQLAPPSLPVIEWGHKISFAYFVESEHIEEDLTGLALDICLSEQKYCSSPQCVFYETSRDEELDEFAASLAHKLAFISNQYPLEELSIDVQSQITWAKELVKMEEIIGNQKLIDNTDYNFSVMVDYAASLKVSLGYRNIWVMKVNRNQIMSILRPHKGHLQTTGLSCRKEDVNDISGILYAAGVNRVNRCGQMSHTYCGEPHDGMQTLRKYVRIVNKRL